MAPARFCNAPCCCLVLLRDSSDLKAATEKVVKENLSNKMKGLPSPCTLVRWQARPPTPPNSRTFPPPVAHLKALSQRDLAPPTQRASPSRQLAFSQFTSPQSSLDDYPTSLQHGLTFFPFFGFDIADFLVPYSRLDGLSSPWSRFLYVRKFTPLSL